MPESGQATPLVGAVVVLALALTVPLGHLGRAAVDRAQARTAADAAALAGALDGSAEAAALARANGGHLVSMSDDGRTVTAVVRVGGRQATARAERTGWGSGSGAGLAPAMAAAVDRAEALLGRPVPIVSGYRSRSEQQALWDRRHTNPYPVAAPGTSRHESGYAIDVPREFVDLLITVASAAGLCRPLPEADPVHFELCRHRIY